MKEVLHLRREQRGRRGEEDEGSSGRHGERGNGEVSRAVVTLQRKHPDMRSQILLHVKPDRYISRPTGLIFTRNRTFKVGFCSGDLP